MMKRPEPRGVAAASEAAERLRLADDSKAGRKERAIKSLRIRRERKTVGNYQPITGRRREVACVTR